MDIQVHRVQYDEVAALRELYRQEANCQIVHDSFLARGLADPYTILAGGRVAGYGAVANRYDKGRVVEFYTLPEARGDALPLFRALLSASRATHIEAQTNMPLMLRMLCDCARNFAPEKVLFEDAAVTALACPGGIFRQATPDDAAFAHRHEPGEWVVEAGGEIVATGGFLCHYNPPYGDIYMEVAVHARGRGIGSYLVQELKRACYDAGKRPAARCDPANVASRRTLQRAGFRPCAHLLVGEAAPPEGAADVP